MSEIIRYKPSEMADAILGLDTSSIRLQSIRIVTLPNKTEYRINETFDPTGMVVEGVYNNDLLKNVTSNCTYNIPSFSTIGSKTIVISYTEKGVTKTININVNVNGIYGVEWNDSSTSKWARTDLATSFSDPSPAVNNGSGSSPFDNIYPWSEMTIIEDSQAGTLVKIPKFYYKWTINDSSIKLQISKVQQIGFNISPAHMDRGDGKGERDVVYIGRYHCASDYKSKTGVPPIGNYTRASFRTSIHNLGNTIWQNDYALKCTIWMLYLVEYADWNSQNTIGHGGFSNGGNMGGTDDMIYHTGTNAVDKTTDGQTQYRWIEGLWDNVSDWCDGIYFNNSNVYSILNPTNFSDTSSGTLVCIRPTSAGYIKTWINSDVTGFDWFIFPSQVQSNSTSLACDWYSYASTGVVLYTGYPVTGYEYSGLFTVCTNPKASGTAVGIGSRLMKLP